MVGLNWDVTQRRRAEAALRDMEAAERASRAKSEFLARMSHELRTPLNAMLGFAQLLQHDGAERLDAQQRDRIERIRSAGAHLLSLIDDVLDLAAVEAGALPVALQPIAAGRGGGRGAAMGGAAGRRACADAARASQRRLRACRPRAACARCSANLMTNAIKYNRPGGQVWVAARRLAADGGDGAPGWALSVRDNGRGLSVEQQSHLFEPFNRLGAERDGIEGRGIGLATAQHLVRRMGGQLQVQSRLGEGSEFVVWLPESAAAGAAAGACADTRAPAAAVPLSMLYVEDNAVNVLVVQELVAMRPNVALHVAADGASGVALALRDRPDLVLVDMQLPDIDGFEVLRRLREQGSPARHGGAVGERDARRRWHAHAPWASTTTGPSRSTSSSSSTAWTGWPTLARRACTATQVPSQQRNDPMDDRIRVSLNQGVADVRLVRGDKMNALDDAMFEALRRTGEQLKTMPGVRAVVLSGEGRAFCAGLDTANFGKMASGQRGGERLLQGERTPGGANPPQHAVMVWRELPVPVIAAVHGVAYGGGFQIMLAADIRFIAADTKLSIMEINWGLVPDMAGMALLRRPGARRRGARADLHRARVQRQRSTSTRPGHARLRRPLCRGAGAGAARSPSVRPRPCARPSGCSTWPSMPMPGRSCSPKAPSRRR